LNGSFRAITGQLNHKKNIAVTGSLRPEADKLNAKKTPHVAGLLDSLSI
jgi:hypothetical protein